MIVCLHTVKSLQVLLFIYLYSQKVPNNNIGNYLRSNLLRAPWLAEKQSITERYQHICCTTTRTRVLQTNRSLFHFDTNDVTRNLDCWRIRLLVNNSMRRTTYEDSHPMRDSTHVGNKILLFQVFEFVQTSHQNYMELKELLSRQML